MTDNLIFKAAFDNMPEEEKANLITQIHEHYEIPESVDITDTAYIYIMENMLLGIVDAVLHSENVIEDLHDAEMPEKFMELNSIKEEDKEPFKKGMRFTHQALGQALYKDPNLTALMNIINQHFDDVPTEELLEPVEIDTIQ